MCSWERNKYSCSFIYCIYISFEMHQRAGTVLFMLIQITDTEASIIFKPLFGWGCALSEIPVVQDSLSETTRVRPLGWWQWNTDEHCKCTHHWRRHGYCYWNMLGGDKWSIQICKVIRRASFPATKIKILFFMYDSESCLMYVCDRDCECTLHCSSITF